MSVLFWGLSALLMIAVVLVLARAIWRTPADGGASSEAANVAVYRQRSRELEEDVATGLLAPEAAGQARTELDRQLLEDTVDVRTGAGGRVSGQRAMALAVMVLVPLITLTAYFSVRPDPALLQTAGSPGVAAQADAGELERMAETLRQRLEANPDDGLGWLVLGRVHMALDDSGAAAAAFSEAMQRLESDPRPLVHYAEARAASPDVSGWDEQGRALLERALALDPDYPKALWLAGVAAVAQDDTAAARRHWTRLLEQMPEDSEVAGQLQQQIRALADD